MKDYYNVIEGYMEVLRKRHWKGVIPAHQYRKKVATIQLWLIRESVQARMKEK